MRSEVNEEYCAPQLVLLLVLANENISLCLKFS